MWNTRFSTDVFFLSQTRIKWELFPCMPRYLKSWYRLPCSCIFFPILFGVYTLSPLSICRSNNTEMSHSSWALSKCSVKTAIIILPPSSRKRLKKAWEGDSDQKIPVSSRTIFVSEDPKVLWHSFSGILAQSVLGDISLSVLVTDPVIDTTVECKSALQ